MLQNDKVIDEMTRSTRLGRTALSPNFKWFTFATVLLALFGDGSPSSAQIVGPAQNPAAAQSNLAPEIAFSDPAPQLLSPKSDGTFEFDVTLKNAGKLSGTPTFALLGKDCGRVASATEPDFSSLGPGEVAVERLRISGAKLPAPCHLEVQTREEKSANRSLKQLKLAQHHTTPFVIKWLAGCLAAAAVAIFFAWLFMPPTHGKTVRLGSPAWDFAKSWTSNLTFAGGVLAVALALSALPELTRHGSKAGYTTVALLLSLSMLVAPLLFTLFTSGSIAADSGKPTIMHMGPIGFFFASCLVTLAAGLAQIVVLFLLLHEVFGGDEGSFWWFGVPMCVLGGVIVWYAVKSMVLTIKLELWPRPPNDPFPVADSDPIQTPRDWPLL